MNTFAVCASHYLKLALLGIAAICCGCGGASRQGHADTAAASAIPTQTAANAPLSANDVSWLFPAPRPTSIRRRRFHHFALGRNRHGATRQA